MNGVGLMYKDQRIKCKHCGGLNPPHRVWCDKCNEYIGNQPELMSAAAPDDNVSEPARPAEPAEPVEPARPTVTTTAEVIQIKSMEDLERLGNQTTAPLGTGQLMWPGFVDKPEPVTDSKYKPGYIYLEQPGTDKVLKVKHRIGELDIGRRDPASKSSPDIDLTLFDARRHGISRSHAMLWCSGRDIRVQDLGSTNGTWVNGKRLSASTMEPVESEGVIRFGSLILRIVFMSSPGHIF